MTVCPSAIHNQPLPAVLLRHCEEPNALPWRLKLITEHRGSIHALNYSVKAPLITTKTWIKKDRLHARVEESRVDFLTWQQADIKKALDD